MMFRARARARCGTKWRVYCAQSAGPDDAHDATRPLSFLVLLQAVMYVASPLATAT